MLVDDVASNINQAIPLYVSFDGGRSFTKVFTFVCPALQSLCCPER
jgi:hypothetical protein